MPVKYKVTVSRGNSKIGKMLSVSLTPITTCRVDAPCFKDCYARKHAYTLYPQVRKAWDGNLKAYRDRPDWYFHQIYLSIKRAKSYKACRWCVGGDIPDFDYLLGMVTIAEAFPEMLFVCFTKKYDLVEQYETSARFPKNLSMIVSAWPGLPLPKGIEKHRPIAWMRDPKAPDKRIPKTAVECPGRCDTCLLCHKMKAGQSVVFERH